MKITDVKVLQTEGGHSNWTFVKIFTDEGVTGIGEATLEGRDGEVIAHLESYRAFLVGKDPFNIEEIWNGIHRNQFWSGGPVTITALSGIDHALWDIKGKALGVPVYQLLGGKLRGKVRAYANAWFRGAQTPADFARMAEAMVKAGFTAMKWDPFRHGGQVIGKDDEKFAIECVAAVRNAVGPDVDLCIECHGRFDMWSAIRMAQKLERFDPFFYEEPIPPDNVDAMAEVARAISIPVATGERLYTRWEFRPLLEKNAVRIIQPDICHTGGITELKKIAAMAESYYVAFQPHNANGPISTLASLHVDASTANFIIQEFFYPQLALYNELLTEPIEYKDSYVTVPDRPGLGADLDEKAVKAHPPKSEYRSHLTHTRWWCYW